MLCLFVAVKRQEDLVLVFDVTLLHWSCTEPFSEEQMWHREKNSAGVSCPMDSCPMESELIQPAWCSRALSVPGRQDTCGAGISGFETCLC